jgi:hypothetical protein
MRGVKESSSKTQFCLVSHPALGWLKVSDDVAVGARELDQQPFSFSI